MLKARPEDIDRFMQYVEKLPNGCWVWTGARSRGKGNRKWYGSFRLGKRTVRAHRFSAEVLGQQPCPTGHHRDHLCCFSLCVNPRHIETVTAEENQRRKVEGQCLATAIDALNPFALAAALRRLGIDVPRLTLDDGTTELETRHADRGPVADGPEWGGRPGGVPLLHAARPGHAQLPRAD